jgi:hypothetical protein
MRLLKSSSLSPVPQKDAKISLVLGAGEGRAIERVPGPPELSQDPSLHHPFSDFS